MSSSISTIKDMTAYGALLVVRNAAVEIRRYLAERNSEAADRYLTEIVSRVMLAPVDAEIPLTDLAEPESTGDVRYDTLLATALAFALEKRGIAPLEWMLRPAPLQTEWLWDGDEVASEQFRGFIRSHTPAKFLEKNLLLREQDLVAP